MLDQMERIVRVSVMLAWPFVVATALVLAS